jgi:YbgC/YbaW family acyl-CoA thioester hydrolase
VRRRGAGPEAEVRALATLDREEMRQGHRELLATFRELLSPLTSGHPPDEAELRAAVAFLRQGVLAFAHEEEKLLQRGGAHLEDAALEHAFLAGEIGQLSREVRRFLVEDDGGGGKEGDRLSRIRRLAYRIEAALEVHLLKEEELPEREAPRLGVSAVVRQQVQWSDVDAAGIVCYGAFLRYFERAESELFRSAGLSATVLAEEHGLWLVRRRVECDFLRPIRLDEELSISARVQVIGRTSLELRFVVTRAGEQEASALGRCLLVAVDREALRPVPVPSTLRAALCTPAALG